MDTLTDIPPSDTHLTPQEKEVVDRIFGPGPPPDQGRAARGGSSPPSTSAGRSWVACIVLVLAFGALANPWSGGVLEKATGSGVTSFTQFVLKTFLFSLLVVIVLVVAP